MLDCCTTSLAKNTFSYLRGLRVHLTLKMTDFLKKMAEQLHENLFRNRCDVLE